MKKKVMKKVVLVMGMAVGLLGLTSVTSGAAPTIDNIVVTPSSVVNGKSEVVVKIKAHGEDPDDVLGFNIKVDATSPVASIAGFTPHTSGTWPENRYYPPMPYKSFPSSLAEGTVWFPQGGWVLDTDGVITLNVTDLPLEVYNLSAQIFVIGGPEPARYGTYATKPFSIAYSGTEPRLKAPEAGLVPPLQERRAGKDVASDIKESVAKVPKKTATTTRGPPIYAKNGLFGKWRDALCRVLRTFAISSKVPEHRLVPPPQECRVGKKRIALVGEEVIIAIGENATPTEEYAAGTLVKDLKNRFQRPARIVKPQEIDAGKATIFLGQPTCNPEWWRLVQKAGWVGDLSQDRLTVSEAYHLKVVTSGKRPVAFIIGSDPSGALYGSFTLVQLFERHEDKLNLPTMVEIYDFPSLHTRGWCCGPHNLEKDVMEMLDWMARWRVNACFYGIEPDRGHQSVPPIVSDIARECERRGITLYGKVSYWSVDESQPPIQATMAKRQFCACKEEDVKLIENMFTQLADRGCKGFIFMFDDISTGSVCHTDTCTNCRKRFGDLASIQIFLVRKMMEVGRRKGITKFLICPTVYHSQWELAYNGRLDGRAYYRKFAEAKDLADVQMFHSAFSSGVVSAVEKAGLRNYVWWNNPAEQLSDVGLGLKGLNLWGGVPQISWGIGGYSLAGWKAGIGPVTTDQTLKDLRSYPERTRHLWSMSSIFPVWGTYAWNPQKYDPDTTERGIVEALFGAGTYEPYAEIEKQVRRWAVWFAGAPQLAAGAPGGDLSKTLAEMESIISNSKQQLARFKELTESAEPPRPPLLPREKIESYLSMLAADAALFKWKLEQGKSGRTVVVAPPLTRQPEGQGSQYGSRMTLSNFFSSYALSYAIHEEPEGIFQHCQWHYGSGLGMTAPSVRNWFSVGFIDVEVDGRSLGSSKAAFSTVKTEQGREQLVGRWEGTSAAVTLTFNLSQSGALVVDGAIEPKTAIKSLRVILWCIPSAGSKDFNDMDKWLTTASREVQPNRRVKLDIPKEDWILFYDKTYNTPHPLAAGPCAMMFDPSQVSGVEVDLANPDDGAVLTLPAGVSYVPYVLTTLLNYPSECRRFRLALWDLYAVENAEAIRYFKKWAGKLRAENWPGK